MSDPTTDRLAALRTILAITDAALKAHPEEIEPLVTLLHSFVRGSRRQRDELLSVAYLHADERQDEEVARQMRVAREQLLSDDERAQLDLAIYGLRDETTTPN